MSQQLLALLHLTDLTLPIGGFSHSAGLETYVQQQKVKDKAAAKEFITAMLTRNLCYNDGAFLSLAYDAAMQNDIAGLIQQDQKCTACKLPAEMRMASLKLGIRLLKLFTPLHHHPLQINYLQQITQAPELLGNYCIIMGLVAATQNIAKADTLNGFYYNALASMITNCVKLIPLGQQDGQDLLMQLLPTLNQVTEKSMVPDQDLLGICCAGFDLRSMQHEQLYSRLYMS